MLNKFLDDKEWTLFFVNECAVDNLDEPVGSLLSN